MSSRRESRQIDSAEHVLRSNGAYTIVQLAVTDAQAHKLFLQRSRTAIGSSTCARVIDATDSPESLDHRPRSLRRSAGT